MSLHAREEGFGGFRLGDLALALPMAALREVVPLHALSPLPCPAPYVVGAVEVRQVLVPVVDLCALMGTVRRPADHPCVVIMRHEGRVAGLLADGVTGLFSPRPEDLRHVAAQDATAAILAGSLHRQDTGELVNVLSPQALSALPQLPMVEEAREDDADAASDEQDSDIDTDEGAMPVMLVRCGKLPMALPVELIHTTVSRPDVQPSVLARGDCRGVIDHAGAKVPVVDLLSLVGQAPLEPADQQEAFIMAFPDGFVAFLVSEVVDVVRAAARDVVDVPAFALPRAELFSGILPGSAFPHAPMADKGLAQSQFLLVHAEAFKADPALRALSQANSHPLGAASREALSFAQTMGQPAAGGTTMITYALSSERASPMAQVTDILPLSMNAALFDAAGALLGLIHSRGRAIPVMCLSRLTGGAPIEPDAASSVLVVEQAGRHVGFAVSQLRSIESTDWQPATGQPTLRNKLARVGSGEAERLLPVIDLQALAAQVQGQLPPGHHADLTALRP